MRELRLRYFIDLVSNIQGKAKSDADAIKQSQADIQAELGKTNIKLGAFERALLRAGGMQNTGLQRQGEYFATIARHAMRAQEAVARYTETAEKVKKGLQGVAAGGGAVVAAGYVAAKALEKPVDYDTRLRGATLTAFAGQDINGLRAGYQELGELIKTTVRSVSGASRDATLSTYEKLIGTGSFTKAESAQFLPTVMKTSVASRADPAELVQAAEKMKVNLGLSVEQLPIALAKVMRAGQEGGFEIKESAKWIGPLMPYMKGYKGMAGVEALVTALQQSRATAGTNDEAANNLRNFLQKIPAESTRKDFAKQGIDIDAEMVKGAIKGQMPIPTYMAQIDKVMAKQDPEGKARNAMKAIDGDASISKEEKADRYKRVAEIYESKGISKIIADLQEMGGYTALRATKDYGAKVAGAVQSEQGGSVDTGYQFMSEGSGAKITDVSNRKDIAASDALDSKSGVLNKALDGVVALADRFPGVAAAAYSSSVALGALTAAAGVAALMGGGAGNKAGWLAGAAGKVGALWGAVTTGGVVAGAAGAAAAAGAGAAVPAAAALAAPVATMGAAAVGGTVAAGLAAVGAPILGAGMVLSNRANSADGLRERIADRSQRVGELDELMAAGGSPATLKKLATEKAGLVRDRDAMAQRLAGGVPQAAPVAPVAPAVPAAPVVPTAVALPGVKAAPAVQLPAAQPPTAPVAARAPGIPATTPVIAGPAAADAPKLNPFASAPPASRPGDFARDVMTRAMPPLAQPGAASKPAFNGVDFLTLTAPGAPSQSLSTGGRTEIKVGEGVLNVRVTVQDDRVQVTPVVSQQPGLIKISAGATNPGGFR